MPPAPDELSNAEREEIMDRTVAHTTTHIQALMQAARNAGISLTAAELTAFAGKVYSDEFRARESRILISRALEQQAAEQARPS